MSKKSCLMKFSLEVNDLQELDLKLLTPECNQISLQKQLELRFKKNAPYNIDVNLV